MRNFTYKHILALVFLIAVFLIGLATLPETGRGIKTWITNSEIDIFTARDMIDGEYSDMLNFENRGLWDKGAYINMNGMLARAMGQRYMNERVKLENGHLTYVLDYEEDISESAAQLEELYKKQEQKEEHFLFVLAPFQIPKYEDILPAGYQDYANQNADALLAALDNSGVPYMDLREKMREEEIDHDGAFFVTDHHWKPETGFWAYTKIVENLERQGAFEPIDAMYTDISKYDTTIYEDWFLGSNGKRTGVYYAGLDDFALISPKFETDGMSVEIPSKGITKEGDFEEVSLALENLKHDYFSANMHGVYGNDDYDFASYNNAAAPVDLKVMSIGDSFNNVPSSFLTLIFSSFDEFDMRYYTGNFEERYYEYDPNIVIVIANPYGVTGENLDYNFFS